MGYAMRTDRYRYVEWRDVTKAQIVATELYDHQHDPNEMHAIVDQPDLLEQMRQQLAAGWPAALPKP